jgi:hypothetical protein
MSITEQALAERKWSWIPSLRPILEAKRIPDHYFGSSSASDNIFDRLRRLIEIAILIKENRAEIIEKLRCAPDDEIAKDLLHVREAVRWGEEVFKRCAHEVEELIEVQR